MSNIEKIRKIVTDHQCARVAGTMIDATTANAIVTVYDALSETNRAKLAACTPARMADIAWKLVA